MAGLATDHGQGLASAFHPLRTISDSLGFARDAGRNMARSLSLTSFVMENRLPWAEGSSAAPAGAGRFDQAVIIGGGQRSACSIRSVSSLGATLTGQIPTQQGEQLAIELVTGQRPAASVEWVRRDEAGVRFKQPIDVLALINRTLISQPAERRSMPRVELRCGVRLKWGGTICDAILRNISARGMQLEADGLPPKDTYLSIQIDGLNIPSGEVMWQKDGLVGVQLMEELRWTSLMPWIRKVSGSGAA